jgi:hypothetical protein
MKVTVELTPEQTEHIKKVAERLQVTPDELITAGVADFLGLPDVEFQRVSEYVLRKNRELYQRLA